MRDAVAAQQRDWLDLLERFARKAFDVGNVDPGVDPCQLAFELNAVLISASTTFILQGHAGVFDRARAAVDRIVSPAMNSRGSRRG